MDISERARSSRISRRQALKATVAAGAVAELSRIGVSAAPAPAARVAGRANQDAGLQLIVGHHVDPTTLDLLENTTAAFQSVSAAIVEQWIVFDTENLTPQSWLAESFSWLDDLTFEMKIKPGITFTNGEPLDAQSAKLSIDTLMASTSYSFFMKEGVYKETQVIDDLTVHSILNEAYAPFVSVLARGGAAVPPVYYAEKGTDGYGQEPIGTGPFVLEEWVKDDHITLTRNDAYWNGPHPLASVLFKVIPEDTARIAALQAGEVDLALNVPIAGLKQLEGKDGITTISNPGLRKFAMFFDAITADKDTLSDPRVRTALNMAVDKQAIVDSLLEGAAAPLQGQWQTDGEPGYNPALTMIAYDPVGAKSLLEEAGFSDGFELQMTYTVGRYPQDKELGEVVASYIDQIGIKVNQRPLEYGAFSNAREEGTLGTHQWGLLYPPDAVFNFRTFADGSPYAFVELPAEFTDVVNEASQTTDPDAQQALFIRASEIMAEEVPLLLLHTPNDNYGLSTAVQGFTPRRDQVLWIFPITKG